MKRAGVKRIWINGSFVEDKEEPRDIDGCWEYHKGIDLMILDRLFLDGPKLKEPGFKINIIGDGGRDGEIPNDTFKIGIFKLGSIPRSHELRRAASGMEKVIIKDLVLMSLKRGP